MRQKKDEAYWSVYWSHLIFSAYHHLDPGTHYDNKLKVWMAVARAEPSFPHKYLVIFQQHYCFLAWGCLISGGPILMANDYSAIKSDGASPD